MTGSRKNKLKQNIVELVVVIASLVIVIPLLVMLLGSIKNPTEAAQFNIIPPSKFEFDNYVFVFKSGGMIKAFRNSMLITSISTFVCIFLSSSAAFIIARRSTKSTKILYSYFMLGMVAPMQMITTFAVLKLLGMMGSFVGVVFVYIATNVPFCIFLFSSFIKSIPRDMDEAATIDGCGFVKLFSIIIFPLLKPVIATCTVITAMSIWNDFMVPLYFLSSSEKWTMPLTVYNFFGQYFSNWNYVFADLVLTALPIVILYLYAQKHIISGITAGAVKS